MLGAGLDGQLPISVPFFWVSRTGVLRRGVQGLLFSDCVCMLRHIPSVLFINFYLISVCTRTCMWRAENSLLESALSFPHVDARDGTQVDVLGSKHICPQSHLTALPSSFLSLSHLIFAVGIKNWWPWWGYCVAKGIPALQRILLKQISKEPHPQFSQSSRTKGYQELQVGPGAIAQSVNCLLCKHENPRSSP